jgi:acyl-CoA thioesterase I
MLRCDPFFGKPAGRPAGSGLRIPFPAILLIAGTAWAQTMVPQVPSQVIKNLEAGRKQTLVTFGTSLTAGGAWVGLMGTYLKAKYPNLVTVHNEGASGHGSRYGLTIIKNVTRHVPDAVIVEFAMNDAYYPEQNGFTEGVPVDTSVLNLGRIIDSVKAVNSACVILPQTMNLVLGGPLKRRPNLKAYYEGYRAFARQKGLFLIDHEPVWKAVLDYDTAYYLTSWVPDSLHPNAESSGIVTLPGVLSALTGARIEITSPAPQAVFQVGQDIVIKTAVTTPVTRVDFFRGKTRLGADSSAPYEFTWKGASADKQLITARLMQGQTPVATSVPVRIRVEPSTSLAGRRAARKTLRSRARSLDPGPEGFDPSFWLGRNPR